MWKKYYIQYQSSSKIGCTFFMHLFSKYLAFRTLRKLSFQSLLLSPLLLSVFLVLTWTLLHETCLNFFLFFPLQSTLHRSQSKPLQFIFDHRSLCKRVVLKTGFKQNLTEEFLFKLVTIGLIRWCPECLSKEGFLGVLISRILTWIWILLFRRKSTQRFPESLGLNDRKNLLGHLKRAMNFVYI